MRRTCSMTIWAPYQNLYSRSQAPARQVLNMLARFVIRSKIRLPPLHQTFEVWRGLYTPIGLCLWICTISWFDAKRASVLECEVYSRIEGGFDIAWRIGYKRHQNSASDVFASIWPAIWLLRGRGICSKGVLEGNTGEIFTLGSVISGILWAIVGWLEHVVPRKGLSMDIVTCENVIPNFLSHSAKSRLSYSMIMLVGPFPPQVSDVYSTYAKWWVHV